MKHEKGPKGKPKFIESLILMDGRQHRKQKEKIKKNWTVIAHFLQESKP